MELRTQFYRNNNIRFNFIKYLKDKETLLMGFKDGKPQRPIRWLWSNYLGIFEKHANRYDFYKEPLNLYHSVAYYRNVPVFSYHYRKKYVQQKVWMEKYHEYIVGYDLFLETDSSDLTLSIDDGYKVFRLLRRYKIPRYMTFSGSKGMHILSPFKFWEFLGLKPYDNQIAIKYNNHFDELLGKLPLSLGRLQKVCDLVQLYKIIGHRVKLVHGIDTLDTGVIDVKRVKKCPYSIDVKSGCVCYPLLEEDLENFHQERYKAERVIKYDNYKRFEKLYDGDEHKHIIQDGILQFLKDNSILKP
jgi:hypothetical protein